MKPDLLIATSLDVYPRFVGDGGNASSASSEANWGAGLVRTLKKLRASAAKVVFLGDSHDWGGGALDCLARHRTNVSACVVRADSQVQVRREKTARKAAETAHVAYHSTRKLTCPYDPCPLVVDRYLVTRDGGTHLSATYAEDPVARHRTAAAGHLRPLSRACTLTPVPRWMDGAYGTWVRPVASQGGLDVRPESVPGQRPASTVCDSHLHLRALGAV